MFFYPCYLEVTVCRSKINMLSGLSKFHLPVDSLGIEANMLPPQSTTTSCDLVIYPVYQGMKIDINTFLFLYTP